MAKHIDAPGKPGVEPTWCSSDKDLVLTALGSSHVWATLGHGILNEMYWPSTGQPQVRDLGFIVAKDDQWWELKRLHSYQTTTPDAYVMLPTIRHTGDGFALNLTVLCDDLRDVVLVHYQLEGDGHRLYVLMAPRLGSQGSDNDAWCEKGAFFAHGSGLFTCLRTDEAFSRQSVGYVGRSDGWTDFNEHGRMTWEYTRAERGNVAAMGELSAAEGTLALAFNATWHGVVTLTRASLAEGFECIRDRVQSTWEEWGSHWDPPAELEERWRMHADYGTAVLKTCEDRLFPGAVVASLSIPWGNSRSDLGGYHLVWPRDSVESAFGMIAVRHFREARLLAAYLIATQQLDGHWSQNFFPNGDTYWSGVQLDQTSLPVVLVAKLKELDELGDLQNVEQMVHRAVSYLVRTGPVTQQDRWEENEGIIAFALGLIIAALVGAAEFIADDQEREYALLYADYLNRRIEDWLYVENSELAQKHGVDGHYIRIAKASIFSGRHGEVPLANCDRVVPAQELVALDYMYLARLGLRPADDERMRNTLHVVERELGVDTPNGRCYYRYNGDAYGEHADGRAYDGHGGIGRLWPLLTGERGHLAVQLGESVAPFLNAMCDMSGPFGLLPEQVWDTDPIPEHNLYPGKPTGSAMPLLWAHAEFVKLATVAITGVPIELLEVVRDRYSAKRPEPTTWHWRTYTPFSELPSGCDLLIEAPEPFELHLGFDGWQRVEDRFAEPLGFGMHGVRLAANELQPHREINLTLFYGDRNQWGAHDHRIAIQAPPPKQRQHSTRGQNQKQKQEAAEEVEKRREPLIDANRR